MNQQNTLPRFIGKKELLCMIPLADRTINDMEARGDFPKRIALNSRNVAWDLKEIQDWMEERKASGKQVKKICRFAS